MLASIARLRFADKGIIYSGRTARKELSSNRKQWVNWLSHPRGPPQLSAGGVADEWVTQLLRQGDAKVFKKYSQMKLQMKREALQKLNRKANEDRPGFVTEKVN